MEAEGDVLRLAFTRIFARDTAETLAIIEQRAPTLCEVVLEYVDCAPTVLKRLLKTILRRCHALTRFTLRMSSAWHSHVVLASHVIESNVGMRCVDLSFTCDNENGDGSRLVRYMLTHPKTLLTLRVGKCSLRAIGAATKIATTPPQPLSPPAALSSLHAPPGFGLAPHGLMTLHLCLPLGAIVWRELPDILGEHHPLLTTLDLSHSNVGPCVDGDASWFRRLLSSCANLRALIVAKADGVCDAVFGGLCDAVERHDRLETLDVTGTCSTPARRTQMRAVLNSRVPMLVHVRGVDAKPERRSITHPALSVDEMWYNVLHTDAPREREHVRDWCAM